MFKLDLEKAKKLEIKLPPSVGNLQEISSKTSTSAVLITPKRLDQSRDQYMVATGSLQDQPTEQCMIAT